MKHLKEHKTIDFMKEIELSKSIMRFFVDNELVRVETDIKNVNTLVIHAGNLYKLVDDDIEDIMVGIKRYKGVKIYTKILNYLNNMFEQDIDIEKFKGDNKKDIDKYNL